MSEELIVNVTPRETRAALVANGVLQEVFVERASRVGLVGNIYKGSVSRVLPGMQAAFIDIGLDRTAFLHASDIVRKGNGNGDENGQATAPDIRDLVQEGGSILVQVLKDPLGSKGARLTTQVTIPSRYIVYMPEENNIGISVRIEDDEERDRLRDLVDGFSPEPGAGGYIVRTAAEGAGAEALRADMLFLQRHWELIRDAASDAPSRSLIHEDLALPIRILRDLLGTGVSRVRVDDSPTWEKMCAFTEVFVPDLTPAVRLYEEERPIFDLHNIEDELKRALDSKVELKSGGYLIIDQTEAMTTIDVNTGAYVGHRNLEETIFKTNLEASQAIARQLRLRNLGGIIILDFIDMEDQDHRAQVLSSLQQSLSRDLARTQVCEVSSLGLVEMTRKRTRESLEHMLCEACPTCSGTGSVRTAETVCYEIFREILREARQFDFNELMVLASQQVVDLLLDEESTSLGDLESATGKPIRLQVEAGYGQEQFDVVLI